MTTTTTVYTGDTIRVKGTFRNQANTLIDADSNAVTFTIYNADSLRLVSTGAATRQSAGVYYYDYTVPVSEMKYIVELKGNFSALPQLSRATLKAKFRV